MLASFARAAKASCGRRADSRRVEWARNNINLNAVIKCILESTPQMFLQIFVAYKTYYTAGAHIDWFLVRLDHGCAQAP